MRAVLLAALSLAAPLAGCAQDAGWRAVRGEIARRFPDVPQIPPDTLAAWQTDGRPLVLLDVREARETAVSTLAGARRVAPEAGAEALAGVPKDARVVAFCSVGWRSSALVARLRAAGYAHAVNLDGSIFRWANEGRPVVRGGRAVREVHPYDAVWGRLLRAELRAETPRR